MPAGSAGRARTLEQLNRSLETLEQRLDRTREEARSWPRSRNAAPRSLTARLESPRMPARRAVRLPQRLRAALPVDCPRHRARARQEDGVAAFGKIAGELKGLREELRHQMTSGLQARIRSPAPRHRAAYASPRARRRGARPRVRAHFGGHPVARAKRATTRASTCSAGDRADEGRAGYAGARGNGAFRRPPLGRFRPAFNDFEDRVSAGAGTGRSDPELAALTDRLEQISQAVNNLPELLSLRSLEEKVRTLAGALEHFVEPAGGRGTADLRP